MSSTTMVWPSTEFEKIKQHKYLIITYKITSRLRPRPRPRLPHTEGYSLHIHIPPSQEDNKIGRYKVGVEWQHKGNIPRETIQLWIPSQDNMISNKIQTLPHDINNWHYVIITMRNPNNNSFILCNVMH